MENWETSMKVDSKKNMTRNVVVTQKNMTRNMMVTPKNVEWYEKNGKMNKSNTQISIYICKMDVESEKITRT